MAAHAEPTCSYWTPDTAGREADLVEALRWTLHMLWHYSRRHLWGKLTKWRNACALADIDPETGGDNG